MIVQIGFINYIVMPAFQALSEVFPTLAETCIKHCEVNRLFYEDAGRVEEFQRQCSLDGQLEEVICEGQEEDDDHETNVPNLKQRDSAAEKEQMVAMNDDKDNKSGGAVIVKRLSGSSDEGIKRMASIFTAGVSTDGLLSGLPVTASLPGLGLGMGGSSPTRAIRAIRSTSVSTERAADFPAPDDWTLRRSTSE